MKKRIFSLILAGALLVSCGASAETVKHEHLFAVVAADGSASTVIDSIHLENCDALDTIADKSTLENIENVSGHEAFTRDGAALTWQAGGKDITYQGNGTADLPVSPVVTYTLDGNDVTAANLTGKSGKLTVRVDYKRATASPILAVSALLLDEAHFTNVTCENAALISDGSRTLLVGWAVPGMPEELSLPESFSFTCDATDSDLTWMYTGATASPLSALADKADGKEADVRTLTELMTGCLTALRDGTDMPEGDAQITDIFANLATLRSGSSALAEGASQLQTGLTTLTDNNQALNDGASQIFSAILATANTQLAASGLDAAGITLPELTADNYADVLEGVISQLDPEALKVKATNAAREQVKAEVLKQEEAIRAQVNIGVRAKVLDGVLTAAKAGMDAQTYTAAVKAGKVLEEQSKQIEAAVAQQMDTELVKTLTEAAFDGAVVQLVEENLQSEAVQAQIAATIAPAQAGYETLNALKTQLDSVSSFVTGVAAYTSGVATAGEGAAQLATGAATLSEGISTGLDTIVAKLLPLVQDDAAKVLASWDETVASLSGFAGYDAVAEGMSNDLIIIIRSELNK